VKSQGDVRPGFISHSSVAGPVHTLLTLIGPEVGLGFGEPDAGVGLGGEWPWGADTAALVLLEGAVSLGGQPFYGPEQAATHPA